MSWKITASEDVKTSAALYNLNQSQLKLWSKNIVDKPGRGRPILGDKWFDYDVGEYILTYMLIPELREIYVTAIRQSHEPSGFVESDDFDDVRKINEILNLFGHLKS